MLHVVHVAAEHGLVGVLSGVAFGLARELQGFGAAQGFPGQQEHHLGPVFP